MRVRVLFFGVLRDVLGKSSDTLQLAEGSTLESVLDHYRSARPEVNRYLSGIALSVNQEYAQPGAVLASGDEVALLPPVSGGSNSVLSGQYCELVRDRIENQRIVEAMKCPEDGAVAVFDGIVRNNSRGRRTLFLDYSAYESMALAQMDSLVKEVLEKFPVRDARIIHRLGKLEIGETSVLIVVSSAHRGAAFDACRWLIDTLKKSVPIWKKEHFEDGAVWADGEPFPDSIAASLPIKTEKTTSQ